MALAINFRHSTCTHTHTHTIHTNTRSATCAIYCDLQQQFQYGALIARQHRLQHIYSKFWLPRYAAFGKLLSRFDCVLVAFALSSRYATSWAHIARTLGVSLTLPVRSVLSLNCTPRQTNCPKSHNNRRRRHRHRHFSPLGSQLGVQGPSKYAISRLNIAIVTKHSKYMFGQSLQEITQDH